MPILSLSDLFSPLSEDQVRSTLYSTLSALGFSVTSWRRGGTAQTVIEATARVIASLTSSIAEVAKSGFLDFASGPGLKILAKQFFNVDYETATFATGLLTLTKPTGPLYSPAADAITFKNTSTGKTYTNVDAFTFGISDTEITIAIRAVEIGAASTSAPGEIDALVTTLSGVTCSNAAPVIGVDEESDASIKTKCKLKLLALSPDGPAAVYDYVSRTPTLNGGVHVTRTQVMADHDFGEVTVYIADEDGAIGGGDVALVQAGLERWAVPICTEVTTASAAPVSVPVTWDVYVPTTAGLDATAAEARAEAGLEDYFSRTRVGGDQVVAGDGKLFRVALYELAGRVFPEALKVDMPAPAADVSIGDGVVAVLGAVTINLYQVGT